MCPEKRNNRRSPAESFVEIEDEFASDAESVGDASETNEVSSDSDAPSDFETDEDVDITENRAVKVTSTPTNGGVVIIKDLCEWLKSPYLEV